MIKYLGILGFIILMLASCSSKNNSYSVAGLAQEISVCTTQEKIELGSNTNAYYIGNFNNCDSYKLNKNFVKIKPIKVNDILYFMDHENIYAFSLKERAIIWNNNLNQKGFDSVSGGDINYSDNKLYITNGSRYVLILDASKGYELLRKEFSDSIKTKPIILSDNKLLVQTISNQLEIFDFKTTKIATINESYQENLRSSYYMEPIIYNNKIIFSYSSGLIFAIDYKNGKNEWLINMLELAQGINITPGYDTVDITCPPIVTNNRLYIANSFGQLLKIDLRNGNLDWYVNITDIQAMSHIGNNLFIATNSNQVAAVSLASGKVKWVAHLENNERKAKSSIFLPPIITHDNSGQKYLTVVSNKGKAYSFLWQNNSFCTQPIVTKLIKDIRFMGEACDNKMYFITNNKINFVPMK